MTFFKMKQTTFLRQSFCIPEYNGLTLSLPITTKVPHANSKDTDETPSNSASNPDLSCLTLRQNSIQLQATLNVEAHWKFKQTRKLAEDNLSGGLRVKINSDLLLCLVCEGLCAMSVRAVLCTSPCLSACYIVVFSTSFHRLVTQEYALLRYTALKIFCVHFQTDKWSAVLRIKAHPHHIRTRK